MPSSGESAIDLRGRIGRTSLPFSAGDMTTFAGTGSRAECGAGLGVGIGLAGGVALGAAGSREASGVEPTAGGGTTGSLLGGAVGAALSSGEVAESLCSASSVVASALGIDSLGFTVGDGFGFLARKGADGSDGVAFFLEFDSGGGAFSSLWVFRELSESLSRVFVEGGEDGVGSAA